jgi:hypothetical protein
MTKIGDQNEIEANDGSENGEAMSNHVSIPLSKNRLLEENGVIGKLGHQLIEFAQNPVFRALRINA